MSLEEVINHVSSGGRLLQYNLNWPDEKKLYLRAPLYPELKGDISFPDVTQEDENYSDDVSGIWIGSKGNITPLHYDLWHGLLVIDILVLAQQQVQVTGRKSVILYSPDETSFLYQDICKLNYRRDNVIQLLLAIHMFQGLICVLSQTLTNASDSPSSRKPQHTMPYCPQARCMWWKVVNSCIVCTFLLVGGMMLFLWTIAFLWHYGGI